MVSVVWAVYLIVAVAVDARRLHGQHQSQNTTNIELEETTDNFDFGAIDEMDEVDDMILTEEQWIELRQRKAKPGLKYRWSEGPVSTDGSGNKYPRVPYVFQSDEPSFCKTSDPQRCSDEYWDSLYYENHCRKLCNTNFRPFPAKYKPRVEDAIQHWRDHTCIEFEDITSESESSKQRQAPHILFAFGENCNSYTGMLNKTDKPGQIINLGSCLSERRHGSRVHEIGHSLGFFHEQSRSDRDENIKFIKKNVKREYLKNFKLKTDDNHTIDYDYSSIMQYGPFDCSNSTNGNKVTLVPVDPVDLQLLGQRDGLSFRDKHLANKMYNCIDKWERKCGSQKPRTCGEGYTGKHCTCVCPPHKTGSQCEMEKPGSNGDYYYKRRNQALDEEITTPMRLTVKLKVPIKEDVIFVKSIVPPVCKRAKVTFTYSNLYPQSCRYQFLHVVTDRNQLEGKTLCDADLDNGEVLTSDKNITINTIIRASELPEETILWEAEITFHDITGCVSTTTTTTTTTSASTSVTTPEYKPYYGKSWTESACPVIKDFYTVDSCKACMMHCTDHDKCTAVECVPRRGYKYCQLVQCPIPVPEPTMWNLNHNGYAIKLGHKSYPGKKWSRSTCPILEHNYKVASCKKCMMKCTNNNECTAVNCGTYSTYVHCQLIKCPSPAPEPTENWSNWNGYALE